MSELHWLKIKKCLWNGIAFVAAAVVLTGTCAYGESRIWTSASGKTIEGEYLSKAFDTVYI